MTEEEEKNGEGAGEIRSMINTWVMFYLLLINLLTQWRLRLLRTETPIFIPGYAFLHREQLRPPFVENLFSHALGIPDKMGYWDLRDGIFLRSRRRVKPQSIIKQCRRVNTAVTKRRLNTKTYRSSVPGLPEI